MKISECDLVLDPRKPKSTLPLCSFNSLQSVKNTDTERVRNGLQADGRTIG
jgi:hypothetical protein